MAWYKLFEIGSPGVPLTLRIHPLLNSTVSRVLVRVKEILKAGQVQGLFSLGIPLIIHEVLSFGPLATLTFAMWVFICQSTDVHDISVGKFIRKSISF